MSKTIIQFGYKTFIPAISRPTVDCRVIPNPYRKGITDAYAKELVRKSPLFGSLVTKGTKLLEEHGVVYVGCLFGRHRSGAVAEAIAMKTGANITIQGEP